ncbi:MAG: hypothetical protein IT563_20870 [Alphaproteobacteria bacterium]|nr:hypothetical protein [Alphaproteobacteria bacterium]
MPKSKITLPFETNHYTALGRVMAQATALEAAIDTAIFRLLQVPEPIGRIMTTRRDITDKIKRLKALCGAVVTEEDPPGRISQILGNAKAAIEDRNKLTHGLWALSEEGLPRAHRYEIGRHHLEHNSDDWTAEKIQAVANSLENAAGDVVDLLRILEPSGEIPWRNKPELPGLTRTQKSPSNARKG